MSKGQRVYFWISAAIPVASSFCGCLPDPRPYDPCGDNESQYYSVPPKGCNGHTLETMHVRAASLVEASSNDGTSGMPIVAYNFGLKEHMALDAHHVYWSSIDGTILRTAKSGGRTDVLRNPSQVSVVSNSWFAPMLSILGLDETRKYLYVGENVTDPATGRNTIEVTGIELESKEARVLARFPDMFLSAAAIRLDQLYFSSTDGGPLYSASLDWSRVATPSDLTATISDSVIAFAILEGRVYYLNANQPQLHVVTLDGGATQEIQPTNSPQANASAVELSATAVYFFECDNSQFTGCQWTRITPDGKQQIAASGLSGQDFFLAADADATYVVSGQPGAMFGQPKLYGWNASTAAQPVVLAAPVETQRAIALDDDYVYLVVIWSDGTQSSEDGSQFARSSQLLRVRR